MIFFANPVFKNPRIDTSFKIHHSMTMLNNGCYRISIALNLSLPEWMLKSLKVVLTFESGLNPVMWPFKWNLSACTFRNGAICFQNFTKRNLGIFVEFCPWLHLALKGLTFSCERAKTIRIRYAWMRIFLKTEEKNFCFKKYRDTCGRGP